MPNLNRASVQNSHMFSSHKITWNDVATRCSDLYQVDPEFHLNQMDNGCVNLSQKYYSTQICEFRHICLANELEACSHYTYLACTLPSNAWPLNKLCLKLCLLWVQNQDQIFHDYLSPSQSPGWVQILLKMVFDWMSWSWLIIEYLVLDSATTLYCM